ncbi:MAG: hypothetical protein U0795_21895 [Pirellulales bacterium]
MTDLTSQIDAIVQEVVRRLLPSVERAPGGSAVESAPAVSAASESAPQPGEAVLVERLITVEQLVRLTGTGVQRLQVGPQAVVTPAARDWLAARRIQLLRTPAPTGSDPNRSTPSTANRTKGSSGMSSVRLWWVNDASDDRRTASLHRAAARSIHQLESIPGVEGRVDPERRAVMLPASGRGIWLTSRPAAALCAANRRADLYAAWGLDYRSLDDAFRQLPVNWLIVDPQRLAIGDWARMVFLMADHPHGSNPYRGVR